MDVGGARHFLRFVSARPHVEVRGYEHGRVELWSIRAQVHGLRLLRPEFGHDLARRERPGSAAGQATAARDAPLAFLPGRRPDAGGAGAAADPPAELGPAAEVLAELRERVHAVAADRARTWRRVLVRRAVRAQSWRESPASVEPGGTAAPVASRNKGARIEALLRNRAFVMEYAIARDRW
jgi:hypothetical protein